MLEVQKVHCSIHSAHLIATQGSAADGEKGTEAEIHFPSTFLAR